MKNAQVGEQIFGTGAIKDAPDNRDYQYATVGMSFPPFDWNIGYDIEEKLGKEITVKDQDGSGSCGGQAFAYYGMAIDPDNEEKSAKFIYSQVFVPPAGSDGRSLATLVCNKGWADESKCLSYDDGFPPSEAFMEKKSDITEEAFEDALIDTALSYANVVIDIDLIAQAIRNNGGLVIGITGKNNGTWTSAFPLPPIKVDNTCWNHWIYCGKAKMINGKKYIGFLNSWGEEVGEEGWQWISEDYLKQPFVWSAWTLVFNFPKPSKYIFTTTMKLGSKNGEVKELQKRVGALPVDGIFGPRTKKAVQIWQTAHNLIADGIVGPKTREKLNQ
jgi:peptidoglycan hydrolase-like protein with peptidoglycan-binding domain